MSLKIHYLVLNHMSQSVLEFQCCISFKVFLLPWSCLTCDLKPCRWRAGTVCSSSPPCWSTSILPPWPASSDVRTGKKRLGGRGLVVFFFFHLFGAVCPFLSYWSWNSNTLAIWCEELTHWKRPWCWERLKAGGEGDDRGWDGWMASPTGCIQSVSKLQE